MYCTSVINVVMHRHQWIKRRQRQHNHETVFQNLHHHFILSFNGGAFFSHCCGSLGIGWRVWVCKMFHGWASSTWANTALHFDKSHPPKEIHDPMDSLGLHRAHENIFESMSDSSKLCIVDLGMIPLVGRPTFSMYIPLLATQENNLVWICLVFSNLDHTMNIPINGWWCLCSPNALWEAKKFEAEYPYLPWWYNIPDPNHPIRKLRHKVNEIVWLESIVPHHSMAFV